MRNVKITFLTNFENTRILFHLMKGFTLIELIIVIAVLGILAAGLLAVLDPAQQILRASDAGTKNSTYEVVRAAQRYANQFATGAGQNWPASVPTIVASGELKNAPAGVTFASDGVAAPNTGYWACFQPQSKAIKSDITYSKYTNPNGTGACTPGPAASCYYCVKAN